MDNIQAEDCKDWVLEFCGAEVAVRNLEAIDNIQTEDCKDCVLEFCGAEISIHNQYSSLNSTEAVLTKY